METEKKEKSKCCGADLVEDFLDNPRDHHDPIEIYTCSKCKQECEVDDNYNYERNGSHSHCWNQESPACGQPLENHKQCCLCDVKYTKEPTYTSSADLIFPAKKEVEDGADEVKEEIDDILRAFQMADFSRESSLKYILEEISKAEARGREEERERIIEIVADFATGGNCLKEKFECCGYYEACENILSTLTKQRYE